MIRTSLILAFLAGALAILASAALALADPPGAPVMRWRVAYVEAGPYYDYRMNLIGLAQGLEELGLIEDGQPPDEFLESSESVWRWLSESAGGARLSFGPDDFYSANWDYGKLLEAKNRVLAKAKAGEIDLILAFGTAASQSLATDEHQTPTLSITATDPVGAGISQTAFKSGLPHVHVQVQPGQLERQLSMFHNVFGFKTLGVPYDPAADGGSTMGLPTIERMAERLGFKMVSCPAELEISDRDAAFENLMVCLRRLSLESEAVYLTVSNGMVESRLGEILAPMIDKRLPTFSQRGPAEARQGVLMSLAEEDFRSSGRFEAEVVKEVLSGRQPEAIGQIFTAPLTMALNIKMAMAIGWDPPLKVLAAVNELYTTMARPSRPPGR
jgi:ABC-type uncharacterized transport system substrate-binding protein